MLKPGRNILFVGGPSHGRLIFTESHRTSWTVHEVTPVKFERSPVKPDGIDMGKLHIYNKQKIATNRRIITVFLSSQLISTDDEEIGELVNDAMIVALDLEDK